MTLKTKRIKFDMSHWHLDTYLVENKSREMREFAIFKITPDGTIESLELFGETFERVEK